MGTFIIRRANKIIRIPESKVARVILYGALFLILPFVPCLLLLRVASIAFQDYKNVLQWQEVSNSPSSVAKVLLASKKEEVFVMDTYAQLRLLEGVCESLPQIVLLLGYFTVTLFDSDRIPISDDANPMYGVIFFILNILYSLSTLLFSLVIDKAI